MWCFPVLSHSDRNWLNRGVLDEDIRIALFQMGSEKAAGPDGFIPKFFQQFWEIVGPSVCDHVQGIFRRGYINPEENRTLICLLPKVKHSEYLIQAHCLVQCVYKVGNRGVSQYVEVSHAKTHWWTTSKLCPRSTTNWQYCYSTAKWFICWKEK